MRPAHYPYKTVLTSTPHNALYNTSLHHHTLDRSRTTFLNFGSTLTSYNASKPTTYEIEAEVINTSDRIRIGVRADISECTMLTLSDYSLSPHLIFSFSFSPLTCYMRLSLTSMSPIHNRISFEYENNTAILPREAQLTVKDGAINLRDSRTFAYTVIGNETEIPSMQLIIRHPNGAEGFLRIIHDERQRCIMENRLVASPAISHFVQFDALKCSLKLTINDKPVKGLIPGSHSISLEYANSSTHNIESSYVGTLGADFDITGKSGWAISTANTEDRYSFIYLELKYPEQEVASVLVQNNGSVCWLTAKTSSIPQYIAKDIHLDKEACHLYVELKDG